jgi:hypothetical protein
MTASAPSLIRPFTPELLTGLFLPGDHRDTLPAVPLPNAPVPNTTLPLPSGGLTLFYGLSAARLMGQALQRAQRQGWRCIGARVSTAFRRVQVANQPLTPERLPGVEVLWLNKNYTSSAVATQVQAHCLGYLDEAGTPTTKDRATRFTQASQHPELIPRLLQEPAFAHLRAVIFTVPGRPAKDGNRPAAQCLYVKDLTALTAIHVDYGVPPDQAQAVFRWPTAEELAQPRETLNPFTAMLPKPSVVYVRLGPVG